MKSAVKAALGMAARYLARAEAALVDGSATRRSVLAASLAAPLLAAAGCGASVAAKAPTGRHSHNPADVTVLRAAIAAKENIIGLYSGARAAYPDLARQLDPLLADNAAHLGELERRLIEPAQRRSARPRGRTGTPSPSPAPVYGSAVAAITALRSAERGAAVVHVEQLRTVTPSLAQLLASIAACEATHAAVLAAPTHGRADPVKAEQAAMAPTAIAALQGALAAEHAATYGYGVAGAHLSGRRQRRALADWNAHRARRDQLVAVLTSQGAVPVAASAAYRLPFPVSSTRTAVALAAALEDRVTRAYLAVVALAAQGLRVFGALAMQDSAVRAAQWRNATVAFPGMPPGALAPRSGARQAGETAG